MVQTTIYAKTSGYVREIRVDKGDRVKKDDVLAVIESPETDQQVVSARSDLNLKDKLAARAHLLAQQGLISTQDRETADAHQEVSRANLQRTLALAGYEDIALDVPAEVDDGARVQVVQAPAPAASGSASAGPAAGVPPGAPSGKPATGAPASSAGH